MNNSPQLSDRYDNLTGQEPMLGGQSKYDRLLLMTRDKAGKQWLVHPQVGIALMKSSYEQGEPLPLHLIWDFPSYILGIPVVKTDAIPHNRILLVDRQGDTIGVFYV